jgi:integrase
MKGQKMARPNKIWFREGTGWWCVHVRGRLYKLAKGRKNREAAEKAFHRLKGQDEPPTELYNVTVGYLVNSYATEMFQRWSGQRVKSFRSALSRWLDFVGRSTPPSSIQPSHVIRFMRPTWSRTTKHTYARFIRGVFLWALEQDMISRDPLKSLRPFGTEPRERFLDRETAMLILAHMKRNREPIYAYTRFLYLTGCRPSEACRLEVDHIDFNRRTATMPGKTTWKTGRNRVITLAPAPLEFLSAEIGEKDGHVFLNSRTKPWTLNSVGITFRRIRRELGLGPECCAEAWRHGFATDMAAKVQPAVLAELMGNSAHTVSRYYTHLRSVRKPIEEAAAKAWT